MCAERKQAAPEGSVFLVAGSDEFEVSRRARHLADQLCPEADRAFGLEVVDAACDTVDESLNAIRSALDGLRTVGFFGSSKLIWLRDASFLYDSRPGKSAQVKEALAGLGEEIKAGLMPGVRLLISAAQIDKRTSFYKTLTKHGVAQFFDLPEKSYKWDAHAETVLRGLLDEAGLRARRDVIQLIVQRAGPYARQLNMEVEKLVLYLRGRKDVTAEDVVTMVSPAREHAYNELTDAFSRGELGNALSVCRKLLFQKEQPVGMMMGLQQRVHDLLVYRTALDRRWAVITGSPDWPKVEWPGSPEAEEFFSCLSNDPRRANPFWAGMLAKQAKQFSRKRLAAMQRTLVEIQGQMTGGVAPAEFLIEWALIKTIGREAA
jgi:DNA polymerase III subunit delta